MIKPIIYNGYKDFCAFAPSFFTNDYVFVVESVMENGLYDIHRVFKDFNSAKGYADELFAGGLEYNNQKWEVHIQAHELGTGESWFVYFIRYDDEEVSSCCKDMHIFNKEPKHIEHHPLNGGRLLYRRKHSLYPAMMSLLND